MRNSDLLHSCEIISAWIATLHLSNTNIYRLMAASLIKALTVLIVLQLAIIVAVLIIDIMILKNQDNAADTTTIANTTTVFSITTIESNDTTITSTIDTTTSSLSSKPAIVLPASSTASVTSSAIDTTTTATTIPTQMTDCYDWLHVNGLNSSGIYQIDPGYELEPFDVYCDMTTDGGGWTVIQRQVNDSSDMWNNTWQQYKNGFNYGLENGSLWLGNDRINVMSSQSNVTLRVEINGDRLNNPNFYVYGTYNFSISDEMNNYTLFISLSIEGNASDTNPYYGFITNNRRPFSTVDKNSSQCGSLCANNYQYGAWWFNDGCTYDGCTYVALNGKYNPSVSLDGFQWYSQATGGYIRPNRSEMKIRRQ